MDRVNFLNIEYIYLRIYDFFYNFDLVAILNWLIYWIDLIRPIFIIVTLVMIYIMIYAQVNLYKLEKKNNRRYHATLVTEATLEHKHDEGLDKKWKEVQNHINSSNPSDWRLAILEADIMLGDILEKMGYQGDSIGDKLKSVDKTDFLTLDLAWEAHNIRNQIAHEGSDFELNERDAKRTIDLFKRVFEEFYYI